LIYHTNQLKYISKRKIKPKIYLIKKFELIYHHKITNQLKYISKRKIKPKIYLIKKLN